MPRYFNTTGPCDPAEHYYLPTAVRLPDLQPFFDRKQYFVLHAPRQTGKTTAMRTLAVELRARGVAACWATLEGCQGIEDIERAERVWLQSLVEGAEALPLPWRAPDPVSVAELATGTQLRAYLRVWAAALDVPLVLLLDEADVVTGPAVVSLLRQLRAGFMDRGVGKFPTSVALIGMRDLRDYVTQSKDGRMVNPGSPFNIKAASITLRNFNAQEVHDLLAQHTAETGQAFGADAVAEIARVTDGQPYLVNALADLCVTNLVPDRAVTVSLGHVIEAREQLIRARTTHLDSLAERLKDPRVARIVQAVVLGDDPLSIPYDTDDFQYVLDLGLIRRGPQGAEPANPMYREVLARQLSLNLQSAIPAPNWPWRTVDGRLDFPALLTAFRAWWRQNADIASRPIPEYPEAVPHLALCAFLQRVVNGGGRVHREFAAGRGAMDLLIDYGPDRFAIEIKRVRTRDSLEGIVASGVAQLGRYLDTVGLDHGWLVVFDVRPDRTWEERLWTREERTQDGKRVVVLGV
jgi:hypothetical protein